MDAEVLGALEVNAGVAAVADAAVREDEAAFCALHVCGACGVCICDDRVVPVNFHMECLPS